MLNFAAGRKEFHEMALAQPQTRTLYTVEEYLKMEHASEARHEYLDGEIFEMAGETIAHGDICTNIVAEFRNQLRGTPCRALSKDTKVQSGWLPRPRRMMKGLFSYPDVVVVCGAPRTHEEYKDILLNPTVIVEVLSESTELFDRKEKLHRYCTYLDSLTDYLLVAQTQALIDCYHKSESGKWEWSSVGGLESELQIASINCTLRLADVYDRIEFPPQIEEADEGEESI